MGESSMRMSLGQLRRTVKIMDVVTPKMKELCESDCSNYCTVEINNGEVVEVRDENNQKIYVAS